MASTESAALAAADSAAAEPYVSSSSAAPTAKTTRGSEPRHDHPGRAALTHVWACPLHQAPGLEEGRGGGQKHDDGVNLRGFAGAARPPQSGKIRETAGSERGHLCSRAGTDP